MSGEDLPPSIRRALLDALGAAYEMSNYALFRDSLRGCHLAVEPITELGRWEPATRRIVISSRLVLASPWLDVVEVLKHEMAHQYVTEVLGVRDQTAHGPTFREVCRIRGIDARAGATPNGTDDPAVDRIRKLLALSSSPNVHEADAALRAAMRLLRERGLSAEDVERRDEGRVFRQLGEVRQRALKYEKLLIGSLTHRFGVPAISVSGFDVRTGRTGRIVEICGTRDQVDLIEHMYVVVLASAERAWREHRAKAGLKGDAARRRFLEGLMIGFDKSLREQDASLRAEGLVPVSDPAVAAWFAARHPRIRSRQVTVTVDANYAAGRAAGEALTVRPALKDRGGDGPRRLTSRD